MKDNIPSHIAIIMDGNGRWALNRGLERVDGHQAGVKAVKIVIRSCIDKGIKILSLFAFSSENWKRPQQEVSFLMALFLESLHAEVDTLNKQGIRLVFTGDRTMLSDELARQMLSAELKTKENKRLILNLVVNYGGRWDVVQATQRIAEKVRNNELQPEQIDEQCIAANLSMATLPEPDLFIRTSGEKRISNFFLWQLAYTELFFCDVMWPDFDEHSFSDALEFYASRERRYGKTSLQLVKDKHV